MKPFSFRLDKILDYRKYMRKKAQIELANARNECLKKKEEVNRLTQKKMEITEKCNIEGSRGIYVPVYQIFQSFLHKMDRDLEKAHIRLEEGQEKVMAKKSVLKKESIKKKTLESLKDLKQKKYMALSSREDQKNLDEIILTGRERRI